MGACKGWHPPKINTFTCYASPCPYSPISGPGEIKRREVSWTLMKKLDAFAGPGEIKRREVVLDPQVSPGEIMSREVGLGSESWTSFASVVSQQLCYGHRLCDCSAQQLRATAEYASCCKMVREHCLNILVVLAVVYSILGLPRWRLQSSPHSFFPFPPCPRP